MDNASLHVQSPFHYGKDNFFLLILMVQRENYYCNVVKGYHMNK